MGSLVSLKTHLECVLQCQALSGALSTGRGAGQGYGPSHRKLPKGAYSTAKRTRGQVQSQPTLEGAAEPCTGLREQAEEP